jgi:uncharacterized protein YxjI
MNFPLQLTFKILAIAPQLTVTDAQGDVLADVQQKLFKLKEAVTVYADANKQKTNYEIKADRIIDFSARYHFRSADGAELGSVRRRGMRSLWKATYEVFDSAGAVSYKITEDNPWVKMIDTVLGGIPILGFFTGYFLHPSYNVLQDDKTVARMTKQPAFFEGRFTVGRLQALSEVDEERMLLGLMMLILLERGRG